MKLSSAVEGFLYYMDNPRYSKETIIGYSGYLNEWWKKTNDPELEKIDTNAILQFLDLKSKEGIANSTLAGHWRCIRSFYKWAAPTLKIENPSLSIAMPRSKSPEVVIYTREEISKMLEACEFSRPSVGKKKPYVMKRRTAKRDKAIISLFVDTGIRVGELTRIQIKDVFLKSNYITIQPYETQIKTKGRPVYLSSSSKNYIWQYLSTRENLRQTDYLFVDKDNKKMKRIWVLHLVERIGKRAGIFGVHPHAFRHTFAVEFLRNGGNIKSLMDLLGHVTEKMTLYYSHLAESDARNAHKKFSPLDNWGL